MSHSTNYFEQAAQIASSIDAGSVERLVTELAALRARKGRLFFIGVGGSAANCSHAVNDFRKLCGVEAYSACDNVAELTARTNDEGWPTVFEEWLKVSQAGPADGIFVLSVGGGDAERNVSPNIVRALDEAKRRGLKIFGIVGPKGGHTKKVGDIVISVPVEDASLITPHSEAFQAVVWHCIVCHPLLMVNSNKWEKISK